MHRSYEEIIDAVERKIAEAVARGEFRNLPLEGKPVNLEENPFVPRDWRLAFKVLRDNDIVPEFLERRRAIERLREELRKETDARARRRLAERLAEEVRKLNRCLAPETEFVRTSFQLPPVDVEEETARRGDNQEK